MEREDFDNALKTLVVPTETERRKVESRREFACGNTRQRSVRIGIRPGETRLLLTFRVFTLVQQRTVMRQSFPTRASLRCQGTPCGSPNSSEGSPSLER